MSSTNHDVPDPPLIAGLLRPDAYGHPAAPIRLAETHISWVLMAGDYAYKIKKPVDFGFLDFSTLDRRRAACEAELRLNRRHAPALYLAVLPIAGPAEHPRLGGPGTAIEYAVQMRRFDDALRFDRLAEAGRLRPEHIDQLAATLAEFHARIARAVPGDPLGDPDHLRRAAARNFTLLHPLLNDSADLANLTTLRAWSEAEFARLESPLRRRAAEGRVRECHGDLHLGNLVLIDGRPTLFDGIEFSDELRWIDVLNELAFPAMDLEVQGAGALAWRLVNGYLEITGDYSGLRAWDFFRVYRALVRAAVARLSPARANAAGHAGEPLARYRRYAAYALAVTRPRRVRLVITHGLSGSGKSRLAARLAERLPAIRLRSDVERKRLAGDSGAGADGLYGPAMTAATYGHLADLAGMLLESGHSVIVDATFLKRHRREAFRRLAERHGAEFRILDCRAPEATLRARLRARVGGDPSDADEAVLAWQMGEREALGEDERGWTRVIDTERENAADTLECGPAGDTAAAKSNGPP